MTINPVPGMIENWKAVREELRALEVAEHPPITDRHGRVWVWKSGELYSHDDTIATTRDMINHAGLPEAGLAERNPNYAKLCAICRGEA